MMNQEDIFKKIGQILNELNDQYEYLARNPKDLNALEMDLFLANSTFLSDHVNIIKRMNALTLVPTPAPVSDAEEAIAHKPLIEEEIFRIDKEPSTFEFILSDRTPSDKFEFEEKSVDEIFDRPLSIEEEEIIARKKKLREKIDQEALGFPAIVEDEIGPEPFLVAESLTPEEEESIDLQIEEDLETVQESERQVVSEVEKEEELGADNKIAPVIAEEARPALAFSKPAEAGTPIAENKTVILPEVEEKPIAAAFIAPAVSATHTPDQEAAFEPSVTKPATLNDILAGNKTAAPQVGSNRNEIKDLKQAISLNDKLRYIKDLFNGYNLAYAEAIDLLNKMPDFKSADSFLQKNYAMKNNWESKQDTADQFYELLNRRFPAK